MRMLAQVPDLRVALPLLRIKVLLSEAVAVALRIIQHALERVAVVV